MSRWDTSASTPSTGRISGTGGDTGKEDRLDIAVALLDAGAAKGGKMRAVLDPGNFRGDLQLHEAVGHASEGDLIHEGNSVLKGERRNGERIGDGNLTIVDDSGPP